MNFIHIPKTAGQSVIKATGVEPHGHKRFVDLVDEVAGGEFFTVVRNPYDRAVSTYYYLSQLHGGTPYNSGKNLNEFWDGVYEFSRLIGDYMKPQMYFVSDEDSNLSDKITTILRYENLEDDYNKLAAINGFSAIEHLNKTDIRPNKTWQEELSDESIRMIGELYAQDFEALGYDRL